MKLVRYGQPGDERPGVLDAAGRVRDISGIVQDIDGKSLGAEKLDALRKLDLDGLPLVAEGTRLGPCIGGVRNFIAVGLNFADHAAETGSPVPKEPIVFNKAPSCIVGPNDDVEVPHGSEKTDWEVELAIVIGKAAFRVSEASALEYVAGYCVCHDVSERAYQFDRGGTWTKGKGFPTFGPLGPWLVTADEIDDVQNLDMWLKVNGETMQSGSSRTMIFGVAQLIAAISEFVALEPGDVITTGTPPGVGMGQKPPRYLSAGDVVELGVTGLGVQKQRIIASTAAR